MRRSTLATALVSVAAVLTAKAAARLLADRRRRGTPALPTASAAAAPVAAPVAAPAPAEPTPVAVDGDAVVLPFARRVEVARAPERPAAPARCGDNGGRTKAGAPCGARATATGRCHHHRIAA